MTTEAALGTIDPQVSELMTKAILLATVHDRLTSFVITTINQRDGAEKHIRITIEPEEGE